MTKALILDDIPPVSRFLIILCLLSVLCGSTSAAPPNIVFIMSDDHAYEAVSCYGSWLKDHVVTPNIDRLAKEGMRFNNFACNNSICSPSRASFLSGQYSHKNGCTGLNGAIRKNAPIFATELGKAGYQTALFGKWHLKNVPDYFQTYKVVKGQGKYFDPTFLTRKGTEKKTGYSSDVYTDEALSWLKARDEKKPFLLCLQFKAPHHDYSYAKRHDNFLEGHTFPEPATLHEDVTKTSALLKNPYWAHMSRNRAYYGRHWKDRKPPMRPVTDHKDTRAVTSAAYQHMMLKYARCVAGVDENVGRVLKYLDEQKLNEDTIVIYTSDQGYWLGQHGFYDKRLILDTSLKMPFVVRFPGRIKPGSLNEKLCANVDLAPTLLDYAGIEIRGHARPQPASAPGGNAARRLARGPLVLLLGWRPEPLGSADRPLHPGQVSRHRRDRVLRQRKGSRSDPQHRAGGRLRFLDPGLRGAARAPDEGSRDPSRRTAQEGNSQQASRRTMDP